MQLLKNNGKLFKNNQYKAGKDQPLPQGPWVQDPSGKKFKVTLSPQESLQAIVRVRQYAQSSVPPKRMEAVPCSRSLALSMGSAFSPVDWGKDVCSIQHRAVTPLGTPEIQEIWQEWGAKEGYCPICR